MTSLINVLPSYIHARRYAGEGAFFQMSSDIANTMYEGATIHQVNM
jgi:hypothetical protein